MATEQGGAVRVAGLEIERWCLSSASLHNAVCWHNTLKMASALHMRTIKENTAHVQWACHLILQNKMSCADSDLWNAFPVAKNESFYNAPARLWDEYVVDFLLIYFWYHELVEPKQRIQLHHQ